MISSFKASDLFQNISGLIYRILLVREMLVFAAVTNPIRPDLRHILLINMDLAAMTPAVPAVFSLAVMALIGLAEPELMLAPGLQLL
jgi:hypothetical protein